MIFVPRPHFVAGNKRCVSSWASWANQLYTVVVFDRRLRHYIAHGEVEDTENIVLYHTEIILYSLYLVALSLFVVWQPLISSFVYLCGSANAVRRYCLNNLNPLVYPSIPRELSRTQVQLCG